MSGFFNWGLKGFTLNPKPYVAVPSEKALNRFGTGFSGLSEKTVYPLSSTETRKELETDICIWEGARKLSISIDNNKNE